MDFSTQHKPCSQIQTRKASNSEDKDIIGSPTIKPKTPSKSSIDSPKVGLVIFSWVQGILPTTHGLIDACPLL